MPTSIRALTLSPPALKLSGIIRPLADLDHHRTLALGPAMSRTGKKWGQRPIAGAAGASLPCRHGLSKIRRRGARLRGPADARRDRFRRTGARQDRRPGAV